MGALEHDFAAMPPNAYLKMLLSLAVTSALHEKEKAYRRKGTYILQFLDVKKAHFWAKAERTLYVEFPWEYIKAHGLSGDVVGRLLRTLYGMRDAAALGEASCN